MPVDAKMAIQICSYYAMIFGMGMMIWTDQMAAGYGIEVSDKSKAFMKFTGVNGLVGAAIANTFVARIGHTKTMSLTCFANMFAFGMPLVQSILTTVMVAGENAFSQKVGMDENMQLFNVFVMFALCSVSYMGWVSSGSAMPTKPNVSDLSDLDTFNFVHACIGFFFGLPAMFKPEMLLDQYLPGNTWVGNEQFMCPELMKIMGMLLVGNGLRAICTIQGGDGVTAYSHTRANCMWYMMILGFMVFADTNSTKVFGMEMDAVLPAKIFDFVRNFGMMYWGVGIMTKND